MDSEIIKIIVTCLTGPILMGIVVYVIINWKKIMNLHKEKHTFDQAILALRDGALVYRNDGYKRYVKRVISCNGKEIIEYGSWRDKNSFDEGCLFNLEDVFAEDWIIEKGEGK